MLKIGIVGAENSHCTQIAKLCNVSKKVPARAVAVWGEQPKFAKAAAANAQIPTIVKDWREMLGKVDGIMIDHRHPKYHAEVATFFVENGVPCFVDKPFTFTLAEGKALCALARTKKVPITGFSVIPMQKNFGQFCKALKKIGTVVSLSSLGPVDLKSKYGGVFFYGIHQVDAIVAALGTGADWVDVKRHGKGGAAVIGFRNGPVVTMNCINNGNWNFHWTAVGDKDVLDWTYKMDDLPYLTGARAFIKMFKTGVEPFAHERLLAPIAILEAMGKSLERGKRVKVGKLA